MLEVCIDSLESAINAIHGGADELEVCSSLVEGGLTPSAGLVKQIRQMVDNISSPLMIKPMHKSCRDCACDKLTKKPKVNVMIRCRTGSDFNYTEEEMDTMLSDIEIFKEISVDRYVFGALTNSQDIDEVNCSKIIQKAYPIPVTFHRAFDMCNDPLEALNKIADLGFNRLLTSGQKPSVNYVEAVQVIESLIKNFGHQVQIMPGAGINIKNAKIFIDMGCEIIHSSCKLVRQLPKLENMLNMGTGDSEYLWVTNENMVRELKQFVLAMKLDFDEHNE